MKVGSCERQADKRQHTIEVVRVNPERQRPSLRVAELAHDLGDKTALH